MGRLHALVRLSRHEDVRAVIAGGADVNEVADNMTPLELAIGEDDVAIVDILIRAGADVNQGHPKTGRRPLHMAVSQPDLRILELLLEAGADVEGCRENSTPLCFAAAFGKRDAYDRLLEAGANPLATRKGKTAAELLESAGVADKFMRQRLEMDADRKKPDRYEQPIRKMMAEYPTVEEYAAHRGNSIYVFSLDQGVFTDPAVGKWARDLGDIIRSPERLEQCEERFLSGHELDVARRERRRIERWHAREQERKESIARAAKGLLTR